MIFDLGLVREIGYYTGAVFEVYDPAVGYAIGGGGRYDEPVRQFGRGLRRRARPRAGSHGGDRRRMDPAPGGRGEEAR